jgi:hypothetical protein
MSNVMSLDDQPYRELIFSIFLSLEPRRELKGTILFDVNEEVNEMFFIASGAIDVGFRIDYRPKFVLRLRQKGVIGAQ